MTHGQKDVIFFENLRQPMIFPDERSVDDPELDSYCYSNYTLVGLFKIMRFPLILLSGVVAQVELQNLAWL